MGTNMGMTYKWNGGIGPDELMLLAQLQVEILIRMGSLGEEYAIPNRMSQQTFEEARELFRETKDKGIDWSMSDWTDTLLELLDGDMERVRMVLYQGISIPVLH